MGKKEEDLQKKRQRIERALDQERKKKSKQAWVDAKADLKKKLALGEITDGMAPQEVFGMSKLYQKVNYTNFRNNFGKLRKKTKDDLTEAEIELARSAAKATDCVFCGVDLIRDSDGQMKVLEVNAVPGWKALQTACKVCVPTRLFQWLELLPPFGQ